MGWKDAPLLSSDISAVATVESNNNPNAVSPKGARGTMQVMPRTNTSPGYGVIPARDQSEAERKRVGEDYLSAMQAKYGREGGLRAYNMGPGAYEEFLAGKRSLPAETAAYAPKVVSKAGGSKESWRSAPLADAEPTPPVDTPPAAPTSTQTNPPETPVSQPSKGFVQSAVDTVRDLPANFVAGAGKLGAIPVGAVEDVVKGQRFGTGFKERSKSIEQFRKEQTHGDNLAGSVVQAAPELILSGGPVAGVTKSLIARGASPLLATVGTNAAYSGAKSAAEGNDLDTVLKDTAWGGGGAAAGHAGSRAVTGLKAGASEAMQKAVERGYVPTIGQIGGWAGKAYDKVGSLLPGFAGATERAAKDAETTFSRARANEALEAIGGRTNKTGSEAAADMLRQQRAAYSKVGPEIEMDPALGRIANLISEHELTRSVPLLKGKAKDKVIDEIKTVTAPYVSGRQKMTGTEFKKMDEELGELARKYEKGSVKEQRMGQAIRTYQQNLKKSIYPKKGADPGVLDDLKKADQSFRLGVPVRDAAKRARATNGQFTAAQDAAATDRARQPRSAAGDEIIANPSPGAEAASTGSVIARAGTAAALGGGAHMAGLTGQFLAGSPGLAAGAGVGAAAWGAHQLVNTRAGRNVLTHGLAGVIPKKVLGKIAGMPADEAARALNKWMAKPEVASVAAQLGRTLNNSGGQDAP